MPLKFQKGDYLAIALVLVVAVAVVLCYLPGSSEKPAYVEIYHNGNLVKTMDLSREESYTVEGDYVNVITVSGGSVAITHSDCPGMDCVYSGSIRFTGRSLVCLPNGVEVRIVGSAGDVDFVVG